MPNPMSGDLELAGELVTALQWIADIADKTYEQDEKLRSDAARQFMRISDRARAAIEAAATRLEGLQNTVLDDAALREILAEEFERDGHTLTAMQLRGGEDVLPMVRRAMSRVSRLEGLRDGMTITDEMVTRFHTTFMASSADARTAIKRALTAALKSPDTETLEALGKGLK